MDKDNVLINKFYSKINMNRENSGQKISNGKLSSAQIRVQLEKMSSLNR